MTARDRLLALVIVLIWGINFPAMRWGLEAYPPLLLSALRFAAASLPVFLLGPPPVSWRMLLFLAPALMWGPFVLLLFAIDAGMPPGLASVVVQSHVLFTIVIATIALKERPGPLQYAGVGVAFAGLGLMALSIGADVPTIGFLLTLASALVWAVGNVSLRSLGPVDPMRLVVWLCVVSVPPLALMSPLVEGPDRALEALAAPTLRGVAVVAFQAAFVTIVAYLMWTRLLARNPATDVAPFMLGVPVVGALSSALLFGEVYPPLRLAGMALVVAGVAVTVVPWARRGPRLPET